MSNNFQNAREEAEAFAFIVKACLHYNEVWLSELVIETDGQLRATYNCRDDFQRDVRYDHQKQHGFVHIRAPYSTRGLLNREQRELHVLLAQQGESTALANELTSAAGRRFVQSLQEERAQYAQLVDFTNED